MEWGGDCMMRPTFLTPCRNHLELVVEAGCRSWGLLLESCKLTGLGGLG